MPRKIRIQYEGAIYHVINRGDRRERIFLDEADRGLYLDALGEACEKTAWQIHAFCLMPNHFHLVLETPAANLVDGMHWLLGTYTTRLNRKHRLTGHLFAGRYKALVVDGSGTGYFRTVCDYVHLNPARAGLVPQNHSLKTYPWSSFPCYLKPPRQRPPWLRVDRLFGEHGIPGDSRAGRKTFERRIELLRTDREPEAYEWIRRGWCLGDRQFRKELLRQIAESMGSSHCGEEVRESEEARAEQILAAALRRWRWTEADLKARRKTDWRKAELADRLRRETTRSWKWIAARLQMGAWRTARNTVVRWRALRRSSRWTG